jgi:hypothetical protein
MHIAETPVSAARPVSRLLLCLFVASFTLAASAQAPAEPLQLIDEKGVSKALTLAELAALPQSEVMVSDPNGAQITFRGPTLRALITLIGAPTGQALRGPSMVLAILAEAADGYKVAYTLGELDEQFGARTAILALTQNGGALPPNDGPLRVVIAGEERHARWIRQVLRLRLVRVGG